MSLGLAGPQNGFTFEKFFKMFPLRYQNLFVDLFYDYFNFGIDICGVWF
jgi:hypothetical protein